MPISLLWRKEIGRDPLGTWRLGLALPFDPTIRAGSRAGPDEVADKCRSNSKLPEFVNLFLSRPLVTVRLGAKLLKVTPKAVDLMLVQLGGALPRELTGRRRYRAWGIV